MIICTRYPLARQNTSCPVKRFTGVNEITRNRPSRDVALNYYYARVHTPITTICVWMRRQGSARMVSRDYNEELVLDDVLGIVCLTD